MALISLQPQVFSSTSDSIVFAFARATQGCYATVCSRPISWTKEVKLKSSVALQIVEGLNRRALWKHRLCLSNIRSPVILRPKVKHLKIIAFKGTSQTDESGGRSSRSQVSKKSIKPSHESHKGVEETRMGSQDIQESSPCYSCREEQALAGSQAIQNLFKKWLMMLRTQSPNQEASEATDMMFGDEPPQSEISESQIVSPKQERGNILNAAWQYFQGIDASIRLPLLMFIPSYFVVNAVYGAEVSKELTPLWILGPLIIAVYVKMIRVIYALYVFTFRHTARVVKNLPTYYHLAYDYMSQGKLRKELLIRLWQPVIDLKNLDYKELSKRKYKELGVWAAEKYLDYIETIWPFYCRTIRFLKTANLI